MMIEHTYGSEVRLKAFVPLVLFNVVQINNNLTVLRLIVPNEPLGLIRSLCRSYSFMGEESDSLISRQTQVRDAFDELPFASQQVDQGEGVHLPLDDLHTIRPQNVCTGRYQLGTIALVL